MAPKTRARATQTPKVPSVPAPPALKVPTLAPDMELPPDWVYRYLHSRYGKQIEQVRAVNKAIEDAYARGDYATAEQLDAQLEQFYEDFDNQLEGVLDDGGDDPVREKGDDEQLFGGGPPSVVEQVRDAYGRYLRGEEFDPDMTREQGLAARVRDAVAGEGFTPTGDDLRTLGDEYNPNGLRDAARRVDSAPDDQINDMARDLYLANEEIKNRMRGGGTQNEALVRFLAKYGPAATALFIPAIQQEEAEAAGRMKIPDAIRAAVRDGLPSGHSLATGRTANPQMMQAPQSLDRLVSSPQSSETLAWIEDILRRQGITSMSPLAAGAENAVFDADGQVVKLGQTFTYGKDRSQYQSPAIWGVAPMNLELARFHPYRVGGDTEQIEVVTQPRMELGRATEQDVRTLQDAINAQGYSWKDPGLRNMGMAPGSGYGPTVIDGAVRPLTLPNFKPIAPENFDPPKGPGDRGKVLRTLIPALMAAGTGAAAGSASAAELAGDDKMGGWKPEPETLWQKLTGVSYDISPNEQYKWYTNPSFGYGGDDHKEYIANAERLMDIPIIPIQAAQAYGWTGKSDGTDITPRQFINSARAIAAGVAKERFIRDRSEANAKAFSDIVTADPAAIADDAWRELTGQKRNRSSEAGSVVAQSMLRALREGTTGGGAEDDPSLSQSEFDGLKKQYGDKAWEMMTPGAVQNAQREAAFDFFAAMQSGQEFAPHLDAISAAMNMVADGGMYGGGAMPGDPPMPGSRKRPDDPPTRLDSMADASSHRGRMQIANQRLDKAMTSFFDHIDSKSDEPYRFRSENFMRTEPSSFMGMYNLASNSAGGYGRMQNAFSTFLGDAWSRGSLQADPTDMRPSQFLTQMYNTTRAPSPIRPDGMSPERFREMRDTADRRRDTYSGYFDAGLSSFLGRRPYGAESMAAGFFPEIGRSMAQSGMMAAGMKGMSGKTLIPQLMGQIPEELREEAALGGLGSLVSQQKFNPFERPYQPGESVGTDADGTPKVRTNAEAWKLQNPDTRQEFWQLWSESAEKDRQDLKGFYNEWLSEQARKDRKPNSNVAQVSW